ncbi:peptidase inhibitor family I36 protein [Streptomyces sp. NPDC088124]|uniref:peptidase inhibitor family I36 protein n=1 Tax=Streptomyces sp. NPDC088124 TaxID=3154654 RepID=UPI0034298D21
MRKKRVPSISTAWRPRRTLLLFASALLTAGTLTVGTASAAPVTTPGPQDLSDCDAGWACFWEWEQFTGAASSAVDLPVGERWPVPANIRGKVSSFFNNSNTKRYHLYANECDGYLAVGQGGYARVMTEFACSDGGTWNNKLDYIIRVQY